MSNESEDARISSLRVRISRMDTLDEYSAALDEMKSLGHLAAGLVPALIPKIDPSVPTDMFYKLIAQLKSEPLLRAAQEAGIKFAPYQQAEFLAAGFFNFEKPLVDQLWASKDANPGGMYGLVLAALSKSGRCRDTLQTLEVLETDIARRVDLASAKCREEDRRIEMGEMSVNDVAMGRCDAITLKDFHVHLLDAIAALRKRDLTDDADDCQPGVSETVLPTLTDIRHLLTADESSDLEFKTTFRWDVDNGADNEEVIFYQVLKTIAAFANLQGGTLLVGVDDDRNVVGLAQDYACFKGHNGRDEHKRRDHFLLYLRDKLHSHFSKDFVAAKVLIKLHDIGGNDVCEVRVSPSDDALFLEAKNKGQKTVFYVRSNNATITLEGEELARHIGSRFPR